MSDMLVALPPLDSEIAKFVTKMRSDSAKHPPRESVTVVRAREIAEIVRKPWTEGGPMMVKTVEHMTPTRHGPVRVRIYYPTEETSHPALIYLHGGGWTLFSINIHDRLMREYAARANVAVIGVDYTRAPEGRFPQPIEETIDVIHWLAEEAPALRLDVSKLVLGGDSAGGNISTAAALVLRDAGENLLAGLVLNYGCFEINNFLSDSVVRFGGGEYLLTTHMMLWFSWQYLRSAEDALSPLASPLYADLKGLPPAFMAITELDVLYDQNVAMERALKAAGVAVEAHLYPGTVHSFLEAVSIAGVSDRAFADTSAWLKRIVAAN